MNVKEEILLDKIVYLINSHINVKKIFLFGSRGKGTELTGSDFDIAIESEKIKAQVIRNLNEKIEEIAGLYSVDIIIIDEVEDEFKNIILKSSKLLYEK